jgi:hypothetical protein
MPDCLPGSKWASRKLNSSNLRLHRQQDANLYLLLDGEVDVVMELPARLLPSSPGRGPCPGHPLLPSPSPSPRPSSGQAQTSPTRSSHGPKAAHTRSAQGAGAAPSGVAAAEVAQPPVTPRRRLSSFPLAVKGEPMQRVLLARRGPGSVLGDEVLRAQVSCGFWCLQHDGAPVLLVSAAVMFMCVCVCVCATTW